LFIAGVGSLLVLVHVVLSLALFSEVRLLGGVDVDVVVRAPSLPPQTPFTFVSFQFVLHGQDSEGILSKVIFPLSDLENNLYLVFADLFKTDEREG
jgi:hypothetical protein